MTCNHIDDWRTSQADNIDCDVIICGGNAHPTDTHLASIVHCVDDEIIGWLEKRRERQLRKAVKG